jgi:hypothetical protein
MYRLFKRNVVTMLFGDVLWNVGRKTKQYYAHSLAAMYFIRSTAAAAEA